MKKETYNADSIQILEGLEAVRKRPSMYIGDVGKNGFHHLVWEALDNSVDEALQNRCDEIVINIYKDGSISVSDNGAGIPVELHKKAKVSALEVILTKLHAGGKFDNSSYKVSGGLHGVGISVVNALSEWLEVEVKRGGRKYRQTYERGKKTSEITDIGAANNTGTVVRFKPDPKVFEVSEFDLSIIKNRVSELSYLMGSFGLKIHLIDERIGFNEVFFHPDGLIDLIADKNQGNDLINLKPIFIKASNVINNEEYSFEFVCQFTTGFNEKIITFVNNINTIEGGTHLIGLKAGISRAFNRFAKKNNLIKETLPTGEDLREGLTAVLSVKIPDPKFESQTKIRLGNREVESFVATKIFEGLQNWLEENPKTGVIIFNKALDASRARAAARKAREKIRRKSSMENTSLPFKLADCHKGTSPEDAELFLVEGDSAGGSAITGRAGFQAILPLRGKILNVEKAPLYKILEHKEIEAIVSAIGGGFLNEEFNPNKIRYHKIIIMTDADIDGSHIRTLLLTFFYRKMPNLIKEGFVYIASPPLYLVNIGKEQRFIHEDQELKEIISKRGANQLTIKIGDKKYSGDSFEKLIPKIKYLLNVLVKYFPYQGDEYPILKRIASIGSNPVFGVFGNDGFLINKEQVKNFGFDSPILEMDEKGIEKLIKELKGRYPNKNFIFLGENEEAELVFHPIHFSSEELALFKEAFEPFNIKNDSNSIELEITDKFNNIEPIKSIFNILEITNKEGQKAVKIKRFKGLGEMEPSQLWESTMDPKTRVLYKVELADAIEADSIFNILMGTIVEPRRKFIEKHALDVQELDV